MTEKFEVEEIVSIRLTDSVVLEDGPNGLLLQTASTEIQIDPDAVDVQITRTRPAGGAPRPGEIWQDRIGQIWFARGDHSGVQFYGADKQTQHPGVISIDWLKVYREFGPITRIWAPPLTQDSGTQAAPATGANPPHPSTKEH